MRMLGGQNTQPSGYTIIEVMIFLAISGLMFVVAVLFISGKQATVEFRQGMQDANTKIQSVVNEVANGEYPAPGNFNCAVGSPSNPGSVPSFSLGSNGQGTNGGIDTTLHTSGCIFLGKVIEFEPSGGTTYSVYSVAARQLDASGNPVLDFAHAQPRVVCIANGTACTNDFTESDVLEDGLVETAAFYCPKPHAGNPACSNGNTAIGAFGFFGSFNGGTNASDLQSGAQTVTTAYIPVPVISDPVPNEQTRITNLNAVLANLDNPSYQVASGASILLCFSNGQGRVGDIQIGGNGGQQFTTTLNLSGAPSPC